ncbi:hypothetical protein [Hymenobacter psychrotolerans]|uniref:Uncharacterized protein n=1 Tax=Hymenobacter psychrotolerans DSM 18569 TaxID=1121959 RepID=A0A1M7FHP9_9BACT|nr:hypothetical protein [Hymenobacter psychrotolerans]SHM03495.1 hypothetical protein SAMN02746009_03843 [Hymenobacter psychrotolerans DSM 18569]
MMEVYPLVQAVRLPRGTVEAVVPSLVHQGKVYAYEVAVTLSKGPTLRLDARQFPLEVPTLAGQSGEMLIYLTEFGDLDLEPVGAAHTLGRYLGSQLSAVFFPDLLARYRLLELELGEDYENIPGFQDDYDRISTAYHPLGFPIEPYEALPLLYTDFGVLALGVRALEQLEAIAQVGDQVFFSATSFSLVSFKELPPLH